MMSRSCSPKQRAFLLEEAQSWLGTPYQHQACCKHCGADCLGLVKGIYDRFFPPLFPKGAPALPPYDVHPRPQEGEVLWQAAAHYLQEINDAPQNGDVLLFRMRADMPARHLALLLNDREMIHAAQGHGVIKSHFGHWWHRRLVAIFQFPQFEL